MCQQLLWTGPIHPGKEDTHIPSLSCGILEERYSSFSLHMWRIKYNQADRIELQRGPSGTSLFSQFCLLELHLWHRSTQGCGPRKELQKPSKFQRHDTFIWLYVTKYTQQQDRCNSAVCADASQRPEEHSQLHFQFSFSSAAEWVCSESLGGPGGEEK